MKTKKNLRKVFSCIFWLATISFLLTSTNSNAQLAKNLPKFLGCTWDSGNEPSQFSSLFNQLTPNNETKWAELETAGRNQWNETNWAKVANQYNYCKSKGIPFKFHTLVWQNQYPSWVEALTPTSEKKVATEEWIAEAARRCPDAEFVDVVNECTKLNPWYITGTNPDGTLSGDPVPGYFWDLGGKGASGWDFVIWAFQKARHYFPHSKLLINDYHILNTYGNIDLYMNIISSLKAQGLIDGIGCQSHFLENTTGTEVTNRLNKLSTLGLPIYISEFDMNYANDNDQKNKFAELFTIFWNHPAVKGITLWNYLQGHTWQANAYLIRSDGSDRPAMTWLRQFMANQNALINNIDGFSEICNEWSNVNIPYGPMDIAFGANGSYQIKRDQLSGCNCTVAAFDNIDPAQGAAKKCYIKNKMLSFVLDANYYVNNYSDLKTAFGTNYQEGANHYAKYGVTEGRRGAQWFDVNWYLNNNADLKAAFGTDKVRALNHWLNNGINEGRQASADFNVKEYLHRYQDLVNAFGYTNYKAALQHWIDYGKNEGRNGGALTLINGGVYEIEFQTDPNKVLDLNGWADYNGGLIAPWTRNGQNNQLWRAVNMDGGYWKFESVCSPSKRCIDLNGSNVSNQATIDLWDGGSNAWNLQWRLVGYSPNGYYSVVSRAADYNNVNRGWDIYYCDMSGNAKLKLNDLFNGSSSCQMFKFNFKNSSMSAKVMTEISSTTQDKKITIFPNPSDGSFTLKSLDGNSFKPCIISISNIEGKEVYKLKSESMDEIQVNTGLKSGIYFLKVQNSKEQITEKLIVK